MNIDRNKIADALLMLAKKEWAPAREGGTTIAAAAADGSDRLFFRLTNRAGESAIGVFGPDPAENLSYEQIGRLIWNNGRIGPKFLAVDHDQGLFLIEDLGSCHLQDMVGQWSADEVEDSYKKVLVQLAAMHQTGFRSLDAAWRDRTEPYDMDLILERETGYFIRAFVRGYLGFAPDQEILETEFRALAETALAGAETVLMHRDFQSRNIMIADGRPRFIDFQGARPGPPGYDLASLLFDPYVDLDDAIILNLLAYYIGIRRGSSGFDPDLFEKSFYHLGACRLLQALGAYGFLTKEKKKMNFEQYIDPALFRLGNLLEDPRFGFAPELRKITAACRDKRKVSQ